MYEDLPLFTLLMDFLIMSFLFIMSPNIHGSSPYCINLKFFHYFQSSRKLLKFFLNLLLVPFTLMVVKKGLTSVFSNHEIQHLIFPLHTSQHITSIERCHIHIVETGVTFFYRASLLLSLWSLLPTMETTTSIPNLSQQPASSISCPTPPIVSISLIPRIKETTTSIPNLSQQTAPSMSCPTPWVVFASHTSHDHYWTTTLSILSINLPHPYFTTSTYPPHIFIPWNSPILTANLALLAPPSIHVSSPLCLHTASYSPCGWTLFETAHS